MIENPHERFSLRSKLALTIFILMFCSSIVLIIIFHITVTTKSFNSDLFTNIEEFRSQAGTAAGIPLLTAIQNVITKSFWSSLPLVMFITALIDGVIAYSVASWISSPIEKLMSNLNTAYKNSIPFIPFKDEKFIEVEEISNLVSNMTNKYIHALNHQNEFLQDISHELKTPLAAIKSGADFIKLNPSPALEDYKEFYKTTQLMNQKIINLVNQLTLSTKSDQELYDEKEISLSSVLLEVLDSLKQIAHEKKIQFIRNIDEEVRMKGSEKNLSLALSNILENSLKYTEKENASIIITLKKDRSKIILTIKDQGIGISQDEIKSVFRRFFRGKNVSRMDGTGLGLSITQKIITAHSGRISVKSQINEGTEIKIIF